MLNSSHGTHRAITAAKTVTGRCLKGRDRRPVGDRAPPRPAHNTLHNAALFDLYFADSHLPGQADDVDDGSGGWGELRGWPTFHVIPMPMVTNSFKV